MAPRPSKQARSTLGSQTLVVDNGAHTIKAGFSTDSPDVDRDCRILPNCLAKGSSNRVWVGAQLDECTDFAEMTFRRPIQKGNLVNWEAERECDPHETNLLLTESSNGVAALQSNCDQMVFEEFEFAAYRRCIAPSLNAYNTIYSVFKDPPPSSILPHAVEALLVIDTGYTSTTITPLYRGLPVQQAIRRLDIGGKFLTNYLKEILSVRQMDVRAETHMLDLLKQDACFVSHDFRSDMERVRRGPTGANTGLVVDYVMPDYTARLRGEIRKHDPLARRQMAKTGSVVAADGTHEFVATLGSERFTVPELLFSPGDVGMQQAGVADMVMQSLRAVPTGLWSVMLSNVYVVGGSANFGGFMDRLYAELRQLAPAECVVRVARANDAIKSTWLGGARLASNIDIVRETFVTKQEYQENGGAWVVRKFSGEKGR